MKRLIRYKQVCVDIIIKKKTKKKIESEDEK